VSQVRVKRFSAGDDQEDSAKDNKSGQTVFDHKPQPVPRIYCRQDNGRFDNSEDTQHGEREKPDQCNWSEHPPDCFCAVLLDGKDSEEKKDRQRDYVGVQHGSRDFQSFHGAEDGNAGSDHPVAVKQRGAKHAQQ
jgi:hypothetical protein